MTKWRLKKGADRRLRRGHPWVFASELAHSPREIAAGDLVEMRDWDNHFLAYGYGHPTSQISFRKLTSRSRETDVMTAGFFRRRLEAARDLRGSAGWTGFSHRWLFAEADGVPGLTVDLFGLAEGPWVAVVQASTAGMDRVLAEVLTALEEFVPSLGDLLIVEAPSSRSRALEGLSVGEKRLARGGRWSGDLSLARVEFLDSMRLTCDLLGGQKTGFFLDQQWNIGLLKRVLKGSRREGEFRILDVCCYVGQWAAHASQALVAAGARPSVSLVDVSEAALRLAEANVRSAGAFEVTAVAADALEALSTLQGPFDLVICDPPAFVKKKADLEAGSRAYVRLFRDGMRLVKPGGLFVASSCSGQVKAGDFTGLMAGACQTSGRVFREALHGGHGPDHPVRPDFPEGDYLKCAIGRIDEPF